MVSQETSKLCFEMLEMNSASQNNLPCGAGKRLRSRRFKITFSPLDKLIESHEQQIKLYERLVQAEKDKVEYLEKLLKAK